MSIVSGSPSRSTAGRRRDAGRRPARERGDERLARCRPARCARSPARRCSGRPPSSRGVTAGDPLNTATERAPARGDRCGRAVGRGPAPRRRTRRVEHRCPRRCASLSGSVNSTSAIAGVERARANSGRSPKNTPIAGRPALPVVVRSSRCPRACTRRCLSGASPADAAGR